VTSPREILCIDYETASHADLPKVGSAAYAEHPTTRALCAAFTFLVLDRSGRQTTAEWLWQPGQKVPPSVVSWIRLGKPCLAHNAAFEIEMTKAGLIPGLPLPAIEQWHDTMALAASLNLPQSLDGLTKALGLPEAKDKEGHTLMMKLCKLHADGTHVHPPEDGELDRLGLYCLRDNRAQLAAYKVMPGLSVAERATWVADTKINERGVFLDQPFIAALAKVAGLQRKGVYGATLEATAVLPGDKAIIDPVAEAKAFVKGMGIELPRRKRADGKWSESLDLDSCYELLDHGLDLPPAVAKVLTHKIEMGKLTSLAKLDAATRLVSRDGRVRWQLRYCGASQTGRWSAKGLQLHNAPKDRRSYEHSQLVRALVQKGALTFLSQCEVNQNVLSALSLSLRSMIAAPTGFELIGGDYSAIEARVLPWLAFDNAKLQVFADGVDIYVLSAAAVGSTVRNLGKVQELALQFGMGDIKFRDTAAGYGVDLELLEARRIKRLWRDRNSLTVNFWKDIEDTARNLILGKPGRAAPVGRCTLRRTAERLVLELPSGRQLSYWHPRVVPQVKQMPYVTDEGLVEVGDMETQTIQFWGPRGAKMVLKETYGGKLAENATQATARDLLAHALCTVDAHPTYTPVMHLHDAACAQVRLGEGDPAEFCQLLTDQPRWADGLPIDAEGYRSPVFLG
jgi:DNA polymerase